MQTIRSEAYADIARIIQGKPAVALSRLPLVWQQIAEGAAAKNLSTPARADYAEAAQLFAYHGTPLAVEAMTAIAHDFDTEMYPDFDALLASADTVVARKMIAACMDLFQVFGHDVPASFYGVFLATALREDITRQMPLFKNKNELMRDRLWDAVLHAVLLVTPIGLYVQSVMSRHGLRFTHVMNCSCSVGETTDAPFSITLDRDLLPAYLQNLVAASFEQYGVNASTSRAGRGF